MKIPAVSATPIHIHRGKSAAVAATPPAADADRAGRKSGISAAGGQASQHPEAANPTEQPPHRPLPELTLEGLLDNWGSSNSNYDFNEDGTVNTTDLFAFLGGLETPTEPAATVSLAGQLDPADAADPVSGGNPTPSEELTIGGFYEHWGSDAGAYDLNDDGTVNSDDLFEYLGSLDPQDAPAESGSESAALSAEAAAGAEAGAKDQPLECLTLQDILQAWGSDGGRADLNGDGTVNADDLFEYLGSLPTPPSAEGRAGREALQQLADRLVQRFQAQGNIRQPPADLHQAVQDTKLNARDQKILLSNVAQRYPQASSYNKIV
jgi:hypothetical protein